jgi:hypothetical protein
MTGTLGTAMWLMMALMIVGMAGGAIAWAKRRIRRQTAPQPQPQPPMTVPAPLAPPAKTRLSDSITPAQ